MIYSVELWDSYNKVENNLLSHIRGLKDFLYMLNELYKSQQNLSNDLKRIYDMNLPITTYESLSKGISSFKNELLNQHNYLEEYMTNFKEEIINPLLKLQDSLLNKLNNNYKETVNIEKNYTSYKLQVEFCKKKYYTFAKEVENNLLKNEIEKNDSSISDDIKKNNEENVKISISLAKEKENSYFSYVKKINNFIDEYIEIKKKNLNEIQNLEEELAETIKTSIGKYIIFQTSYLRNMQYDIGKKSNLLDSIDIKTDITKYIQKNATNEVPPFKIEYIPYNSTLDIKKNPNKIPTQIIFNVKNDLKTIFIENKIFPQAKNEIEIEKLAELIFNGDKSVITENNKENLKFLKKKSNRRYFLEYIEAKKNNSNLILNDASYNLLGDIFKEFLPHSKNEIDLYSIKKILILSTNLFKIDKIANMPRNFLCNYLLNYSYWKNFNFWKEIIRYDIIDEMHIQKNNYLYSNENDILKNIRIKNIVKAKISSNFYFMSCFGANISMMSKILNYFNEYYHLQQCALDSLNNMIVNYKNKYNEQKNQNSNMSYEIENISRGNKSNDNIKIKNKILEDDDIRSDIGITIHKNKRAIEPLKQNGEKLSDDFEVELYYTEKNNTTDNDKNTSNNKIKNKNNKIVEIEPKNIKLKDIRSKTINPINHNYSTHENKQFDRVILDFKK